MARILLQERPGEWRGAPAPQAPTAFHRALEGYEPSPLLSPPDLADALGVRRVDVKVESGRLGLRSFKILGASWATVRALAPMLPEAWAPADGLAPLAGKVPPVTLVAATDGNHGHALARVARILGVGARILVPASLSPALVARIADEGAEVLTVDGTYDDAVRRSAEEGEREGCVLVSDTSWPGYEEIPSAVIDGYATILAEIEEQWAERGDDPADLVLTQVGVGALGAAVIRHFRSRGGASPRIVGVEPTKAASVMASLAAGERLTLPHTPRSVMAGLNCATPSLVAWPDLRDGLDGVIALEDERALAGVRSFADLGMPVGECSGVALAAAQTLLAGAEATRYREALGLGPDASVLLFATDGATNSVES